MKHLFLITFLVVGILLPQHGVGVADVRKKPSKTSLNSRVLNKIKFSGGPIAFHIDPDGSVLVVESRRYVGPKNKFQGALGNRHAWLAYHDVGFTSPRDLKNFYLSQLGNPKGLFSKPFATYVEDFVRMKDRVLKITPEGKEIVLFEGLNSLGEGPVAGILRVGDKVWITSIPNLWVFDYNKKEEKLENQVLVQNDFNVHIGWLGHDLHGLLLGPDGRIYFTNADKGSVFTTKEGKKVNLPHTGAVFRMDQDGSNLEVFATGLRNPQELTFDNYGNLFTGDNNGDSGDKARLVHVLENSNSGWYITFQSLKKKHLWVGRGSELGWETHNEGKNYKRSAKILPPTGQFGAGPSGISYYPGLGLSDEFKNTFFLADFPSSIRTGKVKKNGASFTFLEQKRLIRDSSFSDVDFGYDSRLYALDWGRGWGISGKGQVVIYDGQASLPLEDKKAIAQVKGIFEDGIEEQSSSELVFYLGHRHKKLREASLHELVKRDEYNKFVAVIKEGKSNEMAKVHALWGIEQIARRKNDSKLVNVAKKLFKDISFQVRAQAIRIFGEAGNNSQNTYLRKILSSFAEDKVVLYHTARSLGKLGDKTAIKNIIEAIEKNDDGDIALRHGLVYALVGIEKVNRGQLKKYYNHRDGSVRLALVLALRALEHKDLTKFLNDKNTQVQAEAIRAIYETRVNLKALAKKIKNLDKDIIDFEPLFLRVLYANLILGKEEQANDIVDFLVNNLIKDEYKFQALDILKQWLGDYSVAKYMSNVRWGQTLREPVLGFTLKNRDIKVLLEVLKTRENQLEERAPEKIRLVLKVFYKIDYFSKEENLKKELSLGKLPLSVLMPIIKKYSKDKQKEIYELAYNSKHFKYKVSAGTELMELDWNKYANDIIGKFVVDTKTLQPFIQGLNAYTLSFYVGVFRKLLDKKDLPKEVYLDILSYNIVKRWLKEKPVVKEYLSKEEEGKLKMITLYGGNATNGKSLFDNHPSGQCLRCHAVNGKGGRVGPDLTKIGRLKSREYLLEAMVYPNRHFAKGYANESIQLKNGKNVFGVLEKESKTKLVVKPHSNNNLITIKKSDIEKRAKKLSAMPSMKEKLSERELRDIIEYLTTLK